MIDLLGRLLGLQRIRLSGDGLLSLRFATPPAPWIMLAGAILAAIAIRYAYSKENIGGKRRWILIILRLCAVMTVLFVIGQPILVLRRNHVDRSRVIILLDRSSSMSVHDAGPSEAQRRKATRWQSALDALDRPKSGLVESLLGRQQLDVWTFTDAGALVNTVSKKDDLSVLESKLLAMQPDGKSTDVAAVLSLAFDQMQGNPLAAVVVISDGRQTQNASLESALNQAQARSAAIHTVAIGSELPLKDLVVESATCEEESFVRDTVTVHVQVSAQGFSQPIETVLQLHDKAKGELIDSKRINLDPKEPTYADLTYRPTGPGRRVLTVIAPTRDDEENSDNNTAELVVNARDEKIGVLYVEGSPRYEYRFLKNMLLREPSIDSSCLLLSATVGFTQEGTRPIRKFPSSVEELRAYDVIILGDVDPRSDWLSPVQAAMVSDFVTQQGGGIVFLAGEMNMPHRLRQTALEKLLPVKIDSEFNGQYQQTLVDSFSPKMTLEGKQGRLFAIDSDEDSDGIVGGSGWYWFARVLGPQPAASVLLTHPNATVGTQAVPLVVLGRTGAGRTFYVGSDDVWRWRQTVGEGGYEAFWLRVIRTLARGRKLRVDCPCRLETDHRRYEIGQKVRLRLACTNDAAEPGEIPVNVSDLQRGLVDRVILRSIGPGTKSLEGEFTANESGHLLLTPKMPEVPGNCRTMELRLDISELEREKIHPETDHEFLRMLSSRTGGQALHPFDDFHALAAAIPDRSVEIPDDLEEPLWDKAAVLGVFVSLLVLEWSLRKAFGLA